MAPALNETASNKDFNIPNSPDSSKIKSPFSLTTVNANQIRIKKDVLHTNRNFFKNKLTSTPNTVLKYAFADNSLNNGLLQRTTLADENSSNKMNESIATMGILKSNSKDVFTKDNSFHQIKFVEENNNQALNNGIEPNGFKKCNNKNNCSRWQQNYDDQLKNVDKNFTNLKSIFKHLHRRIELLQMHQLHNHITSELSNLTQIIKKEAEPEKKITPEPFNHVSESQNLEGSFLGSGIKNEEAKFLSTSALVKLVETIKENHASPENKDVHTRPDIKLSSKEICDIKLISNELHQTLKKSTYNYDSDATDDSSCDEASDSLDDPSPNSTRARRHISMKWALDKTAIVYRWMWLNSQVGTIETHARTQNDALKKMKSDKLHLVLDGLQSWKSEEKTLDNNSPSITTCDKTKETLPKTNGLVNSCHLRNFQTSPSTSPLLSRTCPVLKYHKRKLFSIEDLPVMNNKAARLSNVSCNCKCQGREAVCINCMGRYNHTKSLDPDNMPYSERIAILDPSFHSVLSMDNDVELGLETEALLRADKYYKKVPKPLRKFSTYTPKHLGNKVKATSITKKYRNKKTPLQLKRKRGRKFDNDSGDDTSRTSVYVDKRRRHDSDFDIDNMVMPCAQSVVSKFEAIQYKEILTPKWRLYELATENIDELEGNIEDTSDEVYIERHSKCESSEKLRYFFQKNQGRGRHKRLDHSFSDSGPATPCPPQEALSEVSSGHNNTVPSQGQPSSPIPAPAPTSALTASDFNEEPDASLLPLEATEANFEEDLEWKESMELDLLQFGTRNFPLNEEELHDVLNTTFFDLDDPDLVSPEQHEESV